MTEGLKDSTYFTVTKHDEGGRRGGRNGAVKECGGGVVGGSKRVSGKVAF